MMSAPRAMRARAAGLDASSTRVPPRRRVQRLSRHRDPWCRMPCPGTRFIRALGAQVVVRATAWAPKAKGESRVAGRVSGRLCAMAPEPSSPSRRRRRAARPAGRADGPGRPGLHRRPRPDQPRHLDGVLHPDPVPPAAPGGGDRPGIQGVQPRHRRRGRRPRRARREPAGRRLLRPHLGPARAPPHLGAVADAGGRRGVSPSWVASRRSAGSCSGGRWRSSPSTPRTPR